MLKIYGCRDDLIEIEGQLEDEIYAWETKIQFEFTDGRGISETTQ